MNASVKKIHCFVTRMIHSLAPRRSLSLSVTPTLNRPIQPPHTLTHLLILAFVSKHAPRSQLKLFGGKQSGRHAIPSPHGKRSSADPSQRRSYLSSFFVPGRTFLKRRDQKKKKKDILGPTSGSCSLAVTRPTIVHPRRGKKSFAAQEFTAPPSRASSLAHARRSCRRRRRCGGGRPVEKGSQVFRRVGSTLAVPADGSAAAAAAVVAAGAGCRCGTARRERRAATYSPLPRGRVVNPTHSP